jgi:SAM-dependent methyltransferase
MTDPGDQGTHSAGPTGRFTGRVAEYARFRPGYPEKIIDILAADVLTPGSVVADIGSGTGIFSRQIAPRVGTVHCIEPNGEMREYSAGYLADLGNIRIAPGTAESTGLPDSSVDVVTAAQAFHWFDRDRTRKEFTRILRPGGRAVLIWYERLTTGDPFSQGYERLLLEYSLDYTRVDHRNITPAIIAEFFHPFPVTRTDVGMRQRMDLGGVLGRVASSSYTPPEGHPKHGPLMAGMTGLFSRCRKGGTVEFRYITSAYSGRLRA